MVQSLKRTIPMSLPLVLALLFSASSALAQTSSFTYQGRLQDAGLPANGNYNLQFALFGNLTGGPQIGTTQSIPNVPVSNGTFTVVLDFGASAFPGADRYLEITVASTVLVPRQQITSTPYAIRALNATNSIQNSTTQQPNSNFNISDNGTVGGTLGAGSLNVSGSGTVGGTLAANALTAATLNTSGNGTVGGTLGAGSLNVSGSGTVGGTLAANALTAATLNLSGNGTVAGTLRAQRYNLPLAGSIVPFFGMRDSTHIGLCGADNSGVVLGCTIESDLTNAPNTTTNTLSGETFMDKLHTSNITATGPATLSNGLTVSGGDSILGGGNTTLGPGTTTVNGPAMFQTGLTVNGTTQQLISNLPIAANSLGPAGSTSLCLNGGNQISGCSSSLRYKKDIGAFIGGLDIIHRLRPISFTWTDHPERDLGLAAEDVAKVEPRLVTHNSKGEIEGVKYDRLTAILVNAIKQQQSQIELQQAQIKKQQSQIDRLKKVICLHHSKAAGCR